MVELLSEPLYILAQLHLKLQLRVVAEAAATLARGIATLTLLNSAYLDVGIALSVAQVRPCQPCSLPCSSADMATHIMPDCVCHRAAPRRSLAELHMEKEGSENRLSFMQCIYVAVTLIVYIGGMAKDWPHLSSGKITDTAGTDRKPKQANPAAQLQKAEGAGVAQQAPQPPTASPAAGSQPHGNDDEDWELLNASASPDASFEASLPQCSPDDEPESHPRAHPLLSKRQQDAQNRSAAGASAQGPIAAVELLPEAQHSSSGKQPEGVDMVCETGGQSLIHPRSASAAAQLNETLEAESNSRQDRQCAGTMGGQASQEPESWRPLKKGKHEGCSKAQQRQRRAASHAAASGAAKPAAFDRREVLWRCAIFTLQVY